MLIRCCSTPRPWITFSLIVLGAGLLLGAAGRFQLQIVPDSPTYLDLPLDSLSSALNHARTPGYPLFLQLVQGIFRSHAAVPVLHFISYAAASGLFLAGLLASGCSRHAAPWVAGTLLACNNLWYNVPNLATDALAGAMGIAGVGLMLLWASDRTRSILWGGLLTATIAAAWLIRPASLFLLPVLIILGPLFRLRSEPQCTSFRNTARDLLLCVAMAAIPLILYCSLRMAVVGKFSIVAFGGYNLVGISGQFLTPETVPHLPEDLRPLAEAALARLQALPADEFQLLDHPQLSYMRMESNSDLFIWKVFAPAASELYNGDPVQMNTQLKSLGLALVLEAPRSYAIWLIKATLRTISKLFGDTACNPLGAALILLIATSMCIQTARSWSGQQHLAPQSIPTFQLLFVIAAVYAACSMILVILVCPPIGRMTDAAGIWMLPALAALLADIWSERCSHLTSRSASNAAAAPQHRAE